MPWDKQLEHHWDIGEKAAHKRFDVFVDEGISCYKDGRNLPAKPYVSSLSTYLHYEEISPNQPWNAMNGADAAPYFRIFNPVTQGQKFDPKGEYVHHYIPEIASLPNKYLFNSWETPEFNLNEAYIKIGSIYPRPIVDLKQTRGLAFQAFQSLKQGEP